MNIEKLRWNLTSEKELLLKCKTGLKGLPRGGLTCFSRNGKKYYKKNISSVQLYLGTSEHPEVQKLKKRHLLEKMISILEHNIRLTEDYIKNYQDYNPYILQKSFGKAYQDLDPQMFTELGYIGNTVVKPYNEERKIYKTASGLMVRSRIEALIADLYTQKGISFEYEPELYFSDGSMIHPDFKIYCRSEKVYKFHEHFGLLSDPNYFKHYLWKLEHYIASGYYPFYDVLFTYEKPGCGIDIHEISYLIDIIMR